eukprot:g17922.t1
MEVRQVVCRQVFMKNIFPSPPLPDIQRDCFLRNSLLHSTLSISLTIPGTFPCNCRRCYTCPYTSPLTSIPGPKKTFHIKQMFTCTSVNVVYCICCSQCGHLYSVETQQRLGDRFVEHLRLVRDKRQHLPVTNHFNSPSHSLDDMSILGLLQCHNDAIRRLGEQHLILRLGSLQPNGLNVDFTSFKMSPSPTSSQDQHPPVIPASRLSIFSPT